MLCLNRVFHVVKHQIPLTHFKLRKHQSAPTSPITVRWAAKGEKMGKNPARKII